MYNHHLETNSRLKMLNALAVELFPNFTPTTPLIQDPVPRSR
jgi:hypothetical protein